MLAGKCINSEVTCADIVSVDLLIYGLYVVSTHHTETTIFNSFNKLEELSSLTNLTFHRLIGEKR